MVANWSSRFAPLPTLPGLMRYFASARAQSGNCVSSLWPLKWKSPTSGTLQPAASSRSRIGATCAAASGELTVMRTSSEPARASASTCRAVASASAVSVLVIDCTTIGAPPPMTTPSTATGRETLLLEELMKRLFQREPRDFHFHVRQQINLAVVVAHLHVLGVADDDVVGRDAAHHALRARGIERGNELASGGVGDLGPCVLVEAQHEAVRSRGFQRGGVLLLVLDGL